QRDSKIAIAASELADAWSKREDAAATGGVDCADTTLSASGIAHLVDSASGAIVAAVNAGLDLHERPHARCGGTLLDAAAQKCARLLGAESTLVRNLAKDPHETTRNAAKARAAEKFSRVFTRVRQAGCPTAATGAGLESLVDDLVSSI